MTEKKSTKKIIAYNILFVVITGSLFLFLWNAPPETTAFLPLDENHERFMPMGKKEAEKFCNDCHGDGEDAELSADHPDKYRCLFCHKRVVPEKPEE